MRLILHTAAYWLMRTVRDAIPRPQVLASGRVLHDPAEIVEGRGAHQRDREPGQAGIRRQLSGC